MDTELWTEFQTGVRQRDKGEMAVSLWSSGILRLNSKAFRAMGKPAAVKLFFNRSERSMALVPAEPGEQNAVGFRQMDGSHGRILSALAFCRQFGILPEKVISFDPPSISPEGAMIIDLKSQSRYKSDKRDGLDDLTRDR